MILCLWTFLLYFLNVVSSEILSVCKLTTSEINHKSENYNGNTTTNLFHYDIVQKDLIAKGEQGEKGNKGSVGAKGTKGESCQVNISDLVELKNRLDFDRNVSKSVVVTLEEKVLNLEEKLQEHNSNKSLMINLEEKVLNLEEKLQGFISCSSNPCMNGNCSYSNNSYVCSCNPGYFGKNCAEKSLITSCNDVLDAGFTESKIYNLTVNGSSVPVSVFCELNSTDGPWLVLQRRINGSVDFFRGWSSYEVGFGNLYGEFWIGLENLHLLTSSQSNELRVDLEDWKGNKVYALYKNFTVGNAASKYVLKVGGYSGTAGDSMAYHNNQKFTTKDQDNDRYSSVNCAVLLSGAWWFNDCHTAHLNAVYHSKEIVIPGAISWATWKNNFYAVKTAEMKMKPK